MGMSAAAGGKFRTLCVRLCDGYYYPISASASRSSFMSDQMRCNAACGAEARLFCVSAKNPDMNEAVDMSGRPYSGLSNAFRYRKSLVQGCQCRPEPWSEAEMARHRRYAEAEATRARPHREAAVALVDANTVQSEGATRAVPAEGEASADTAKPTILAEAPRQGDDATPISGARQSQAQIPPAEPAEVVPLPAVRHKSGAGGRAGQTTTVRIVAASRVRVVEVPRGQRNAGEASAKPRQAKPVRVATPRPPSAPPISGGMALGGGTLVWLGDAPAGRRRNG